MVEQFLRENIVNLFFGLITNKHKEIFKDECAEGTQSDNMAIIWNMMNQIEWRLFKIKTTLECPNCQVFINFHQLKNSIIVNYLNSSHN